jgi:hypothetical protein
MAHMGHMGHMGLSTVLVPAADVRPEFGVDGCTDHSNSCSSVPHIPTPPPPAPPIGSHTTCRCLLPPQAHKAGFWGSAAGEELPAPEFTTQGISLQLQCELTRSQRGGSLMSRTTPAPAASESTTCSDELPSPGSMQRQPPVRSALPSPPSARPVPGDVMVPMPPRVVPVVSLHAMVAAADEKAEQEELAQLRVMVSESGVGAEGRRQRPGASMDMGSGSTSVVQYMAEREGLALGGASGRASPPLHQAVRALERKVHGRGFLRAFSSSDGDDQHSSGYWDSASAPAAQPGPGPGVSSRTHSGLPALPNGHSLRSTSATTPGHSPIAMQRTTSAPLLASQIDTMLGIRVRKVSPVLWQEPSGLASMQTWLSASRQASMSGDLADPQSQGSARPSLDISHSSLSLQPSLSLGSELRQQSWPTTTLAAANGGRDVGPSHFQLQLMRLPSGASEARQILASEPPKPPELQRAQSALSSGAMRLLEVAELSVSYTSNGDSHGDALLQAAVDASEEGSSVANSSMRGRRASSGPGGGLAASANAQSLSSMGSVHRPQHPPLTRHASWGTTMAGARSMMTSLSARGSRSSQYLGGMDMGPDKRTRGQYLQPVSTVSTVSTVSSPPSTESNLMGLELALQQQHPSSIPEGSTLQMPEQMVSAFANVDFQALSRQYNDSPEPAVRGGRLKRYSSSAGLSIRSCGTSSQGGSVDGADMVGSPLQQLLLLSQAGGSTLASEAASSSDNNVVAAGSSQGGSAPGPGYSQHAPAPIAIVPARGTSSLLDLVASGRVSEEAVVSEGCVRGGLGPFARSSSLAGSWHSTGGGGLLLGSLPGSSGSLTHRSSMETSPQASVVAGCMAADMSPQQPAKIVMPQPPALHNAGLPEAYTIRPLSHQEQQQERQLRDLPLAQQLPAQQDVVRKSGSTSCEPHMASVESNASFLLWSQQPEPSSSSRPAAAAGGGRHSRSVSASSSFRLTPAGPGSETSALSSRLSAELQRSGPASGDSQAGHSPSASVISSLLRAADAADAADAGDAAVADSNAEALVGSPAPSKLKLSGLMYTYPQGPLSPASSRTGTMDSASYWPQSMSR